MTDSPQDFAQDGIEQLDNPPPSWWYIVLAASLSVCPFYIMFYHGGAEGRLETDYYDAALAANTRQQFDKIGILDPDANTIARFMAKDNWLRVGKVIFKSKCASCHGRNAEGKVGPNMTDDQFKHIKTLDDVATVILKGANNNAMPAWDGKLHPNEIVMVAAYIASLRGTNAEGGKSGEGSKIDPWPAYVEQPAAGEESNEI